jgi:hypothetical protein
MLLSIPNEAIEQNTHRCQSHRGSARREVNVWDDEFVENEKEVIERQADEANAAPEEKAISASRV